MHSDSGLGGLFFVIVLGGSLAWVLSYRTIRLFLPPEQQKNLDAVYNKWMQYSIGSRRHR